MNRVRKNIVKRPREYGNSNTQEGSEPQPVSMANTKKEMLEAYGRLLKKLQAKREAEKKPEQKIEEKKVRQAVEVADSLSMEGVGKEIAGLKAEVGKVLVELSDNLESE